MKKKDWIGLQLIVFSTFFLASGFFVYLRTDGFTPSLCQTVIGTSKIDLSFSTCPTEFTYLGRGRQAFVFESKDHKIVLKLFDKSHLNVSWYAKIPGFFSAHKQRKLERFRHFPESYQLAFETVRKETGLLCVHIGSSSMKLPTIQVIDKASRQFSLNLNELAFIMQEKGKGTLLEKLDEVKQDPEMLKACIDQYLYLHAKRIGQSIADRERDIRWNYVWKEKTLLYIDPARFFYDQELSNSDRLRREWSNCSQPLRAWLEQRAPQLIPWYETRLAEEFAQTQFFLKEKKG